MKKIITLAAAIIALTSCKAQVIDYNEVAMKVVYIEYENCPHTDIDGNTIWMKNKVGVDTVYLNKNFNVISDKLSTKTYDEYGRLIFEKWNEFECTDTYTYDNNEVCQIEHALCPGMNEGDWVEKDFSYRGKIDSKGRITSMWEIKDGKCEIDYDVKYERNKETYVSYYDGKISRVYIIEYKDGFKVSHTVKDYNGYGEEEVSYYIYEHIILN